MIQGYKASVTVKHSLDECTKRIQSFSDGGLLNSNRVRFWVADEHITDYEIRLWRFSGFLGTVSGDLVYQDSQSTLVTCKAELATRFKLGIPIYLLLAIMFTLSDLSNGRFPIGLFFILWGLLCWVIWTWMCNMFAESLVNRLEQD